MGTFDWNIQKVISGSTFTAQHIFKSIDKSIIVIHQYNYYFTEYVKKNGVMVAGSPLQLTPIAAHCLRFCLKFLPLFVNQPFVC